MQISLRLAPALGVLPLTGNPFWRQRLPEPLAYYSSSLTDCKGLCFVPSKPMLTILNQKLQEWRRVSENAGSIPP
jgi:hypothetical protein